MKLYTILLIGFIAAFTSCQEDGEDGVGNRKATQYGGITITLEGQDPDGNDFKSTKEFAWTPDVSNSVFYDYGEYGYGYNGFDVKRLYSPFSTDLIEFYFMTYGDEFYLPVFHIKYTIESGNKYFTIDDHFGGLMEESISEYSYDPETGKLKFNFSFAPDHEDNDTGLAITGKVDITTVVSEVSGF